MTEYHCKHERVEACLFFYMSWWWVCLSCGNIFMNKRDIQRDYPMYMMSDINIL